MLKWQKQANMQQRYAISNEQKYSISNEQRYSISYRLNICNLYKFCLNCL